MIPTELIKMIEAQADGLTAFSQYLQSCANIDDLRNMARLFRAYQKELDDGEMPTNEVLPSMLVVFATRLAAGDDLVAEKYTTAQKIGCSLHPILEDSEPSELAFLKRLFDAIEHGHREAFYGGPRSRVSVRESITAFMKSVDAPAKPRLAKPTRKALAKTKVKKAA